MMSSREQVLELALKHRQHFASLQFNPVDPGVIPDSFFVIFSSKFCPYSLNLP